MKKQLNFILLAVMAVFSITFVSCGNDDDEPNSAFVGTWAIHTVAGWSEENFKYMQLRSDGSYVRVSNNDAGSTGIRVVYGTWTVSENSLTIAAADSQPTTAEIKKIEKDKLTISNEWGITVYLIRVDDSVIEKYL